jgi:mannose-1-phosphate guanylyltransferase
MRGKARVMVLQAFVLGAGLGTRLRPLTDELPKPLMPIFQKPLITFALDHLISHGVEQFVINTHHLAPHFQPLLAGELYRGRPVKLVHEPDLLETGGGIKNAQRWLGQQPFIVYSGDILTDVDLQALLLEHARGRNEVTLGLRKTGLAAGITLVNGRVLEIGKGSKSEENFDYANISVWNPTVFDRIPPGQKISFIPILVEWMKQGAHVGGVVLDQGEWFNIGSRREYLGVHRIIHETGWRPDYVAEPDWPNSIAESALIDVEARIEGFSVLGAECRVGAGAVVRDTIVWPGADIASRTELQSCIVRSRKAVHGSHHDADI